MRILLKVTKERQMTLHVVRRFSQLHKLQVALLLFFIGSAALAKPKVVTTFSVLEDIVSQLTNDDVDLINLVPAGVDPHLFEPGPKEISKIREARIIFSNGLHFEPWLERLIQTSSESRTVVFASRKARPRLIVEKGLQVADPHAWNSPPELISYIQVVSEELSKAFPKETGEIGQRSRDLIGKVEAIHARFATRFSQVPKSKRVLLTTHDAAGYLAKTYSIKSLAPIGLSTSDDFKTADLSRMLSDIERYKVKVIFTEPSYHRVLSERLAAKANIQLGPELYLDGLSVKGGPADTVERMLNHNLESILDSMER
jgi:zinc/manganese transport system substrate-binding protein